MPYPHVGQKDAFIGQRMRCSFSEISIVVRGKNYCSSNFESPRLRRGIFCVTTAIFTRVAAYALTNLVLGRWKRRISTWNITHLSSFLSHRNYLFPPRHCITLPDFLYLLFCSGTITLSLGGRHQRCWGGAVGPLHLLTALARFVQPRVRQSRSLVPVRKGRWQL